MLQVNAVLGPATRTHTIYEHIEVVVHPLGVHLTEAVATAFWVGLPFATCLICSFQPFCCACN